MMASLPSKTLGGDMMDSEFGIVSMLFLLLDAQRRLYCIVRSRGSSSFVPLHLVDRLVILRSRALGTAGGVKPRYDSSAASA
jgi:hypothetical protein